MEQPTKAPQPGQTNPGNNGLKKRGPLKVLWRKIRKPLAKSQVVKHILVSMITTALRFIHRTNRLANGSDSPQDGLIKFSPVIVALWHGQHLLAPLVLPKTHKLTALFSRSADAELNARVAEKLGLAVVRGSGGRAGVQDTSKGGARALIQMKRIVETGGNVAMIADIPHGTPREAGLGIVTLGRLTGRPIVPLAIATSRRKIIERSWDKTAINLPFGRRSIVVGEPVFVAADADEMEMERMRVAVTESLNEATRRAYNLVDGEL